MHATGILMHMRTTLNIDEAMMAEAMRLTGFTEKTAVVHAGLRR
jgi:Arc/MetJ family transcription regulator